jgi:hypothetical protein
VGRGSITDIVTGLQLLSHCYLQQAHSVIRPVQENCELLDLFAADPDAASRWMETETPGKEFSPRAVREQLGQNGPEETYGHLSEIGTHPRLAGMQSAGGILVSDEGEKRGVLRIGPFWPEHPRTITAFFLRPDRAAPVLHGQEGTLFTPYFG